MAFQFVVETGIGDPDANSYVSVEYADDYIEVNAYASVQWSLLDEDQKERLLVRATKEIDRKVKWLGERVDRDSGLRWPRSGVHDEDGFIIRDDEIPDVLRDAVCEFAIVLMTVNWSDTSVSAGSLQRIKVDVIELEMSESASISRLPLPENIALMLEHLGYIDTGRKTAFKKIIRH